MIVVLGVLLGAALGVRQVRRMQGSRLDMLQYGAVWGIIGGLVGLFVTIGLERVL